MPPDEINVCIVVDEDLELLRKIQDYQHNFQVLYNEERQGYWGSLRIAAQHTNGKFIVALANDLLPGSGWLKRGLEAHKKTFGDGDGLIGFNDGVHFGEHASHFLVNRSMLRRWYGNDYFPQMYDHSFGDVEISIRAQEEGRFAVANFAVLFHNHFYNGRKHDEVYDLGYSKNEEDRKMFNKRRWSNWANA